MMLARTAPKVQVDIHYSDALANVVHQSYDAGIRLASSVDLDMIGVPIFKEYIWFRCAGNSVGLHG